MKRKNSYFQLALSGFDSSIIFKYLILNLVGEKEGAMVDQAI